LAAVAPPLWWLILPTALLRAWVAYEVAGRALAGPIPPRRWGLIPLQDLLSFTFWLAGFFGNTIVWRGRRYLVDKQGMLAQM
jgi:ceramide glucosyltransferase